jgi:C-terminal processing protease CtpA/Prc
MVNQGKADDENVRRASAAIAQLRAAPGFLVDLRSASGGDEGKAQAIARLFCGKDTVYAKSKYRKGAGHDQFTRSYPRLLKASEEPFTKPVVCLIGPGAVSSGEGFVQMMKCLPQVTTIGLPTRGASGNPRPFELEGLGMSVWFSRWVDLMPNDSPFEGAGIAPDVSVEGEAKQYALSDQTLEKALELLQKKVKKPE